MPGKKKKGGSRPHPPQHTDSLRADIAAATSDPFADQGADDDIAAQLLASLDARDEAAGQGGQDLGRPQPASSSTALDVPDRGSSRRGRGSSSGSGGIIDGLKEAGEKLFNHRSPPSSPSKAATEPLSGDDTPQSLQPVRSSGSGSSGTKEGSSHHHHHSLRGIFGHKPEDDGSAGGKKISRQKARKQRKDAEAAADRARFEEELRANGGNVDEADAERKGMIVACDSLAVDMHEINPDGHCLYSAIADQLALQGLGASSGVKDYQGARCVTAQFMRQHKDDFAPFISDSDERMAGIEHQGGASSKEKMEEHYFSYCDAIETTGVWGGQPEILAMSRAFHKPIWVVQAGQPIVKVGQEEGHGKGQPLMISYHRKMYGLGEHYNSLRPRGK